MLLEELAEIFKESPDYKKKIDFLVPENDLSMTFELQDTIITLLCGISNVWRWDKSSSENLRIGYKSITYQRSMVAEYRCTTYGTFSYIFSI